jgi:two-component system sensor histidine kinase TctE
VLQSVDMAAIAKEVTAEMVPNALPANIDLGFEGLEEAVVLADAVLLAEVLKNLVANAISYAGAGAMVTVRVLEEAGHPVLEVEDNGPGLSADQRAAAVQARRGATRPLPSLAKGQSSGMGLGLAITAEISVRRGSGSDHRARRDGTFGTGALSGCCGERCSAAQRLALGNLSSSCRTQCH